MESLLLTLHIIVALSLVISVLLQRSEGGLGGLGGGMSNIMSPQSGSNFFTKLTFERIKLGDRLIISEKKINTVKPAKTKSAYSALVSEFSLNRVFKTMLNTNK